MTNKDLPPKPLTPADPWEHLAAAFREMAETAVSVGGFFGADLRPVGSKAQQAAAAQVHLARTRQAPAGAGLVAKGKTPRKTRRR